MTLLCMRDRGLKLSFGIIEYNMAWLKFEALQKFQITNRLARLLILVCVSIIVTSMIVFTEIKDGRKAYRSRKNHKTKIPFQKDGFYKCIGLSAWVRYEKYEFRLEEIYYFLGLRKLLYTESFEETSFHDIILRIIPKIKKDFEEILKDAQKFYDSRNNYLKYYDWSCGRT